MRDPRIAQVPPSPLSQHEVPGKIVPVRVTGGFFENLPPSALIFFNRTFVSRVPSPLQMGAAASPFPRQLQIVAFQVPARQVLVVKDVVFTGFQRSGIDPQDVAPVADKRLLGFVTYSFRISNSSPLDFATNVGGAATPGGQSEFAPIAGVNTFPTNAFPFGGSIKNINPLFAAYARPAQNVVLSYTLLQPPRIDVRQFSAELSGYIMEEVHFDRMHRGVSG